MNDNDNRKTDSHVDLSKRSSVNLNKVSQTDSGGGQSPMMPSPDNQPKNSVKEFGCGCITIIIIIAIVSSLANCLGCGGKESKDETNSKSAYSSSIKNSSVTSSGNGGYTMQDSYDASGVVNAATALFNAVKSGDASTGSRYVIDDARLQKIPGIYAQNIPDHLYTELVKVVSQFRFYPGTPRIDSSTGKASIDVRFEVPDADRIVSVAKLCLQDLLTSSSNILTFEQTIDFYIKAIGYITSEFGIPSLENYPEDLVGDLMTAALIHCCSESGLFDNIPYVTKIHTFEFTYLDSVWKLSGCDDLESFSLTLAGDIDPSSFSSEDNSTSALESSTTENSFPETSVPESDIYNKDDVVRSASDLLNAIKNSDESTASALIIDDEELQRLSRLYDAEPNTSNLGEKLVIEEILRVTSRFKFTFDTPVINTETGTASVDVKISMPDINQVLDIAILMADDMLLGTDYILDMLSAQYYYERVTIYAKGHYGHDLSDYSEEELSDVIVAGTIGYCNNDNYFSGRVDTVYNTFTLTFEYHDGNWLLSDCGDYSNFTKTLWFGNWD